MIFNTCPICGANLDPGEKCDCQEENNLEEYNRKDDEERKRLAEWCYEQINLHNRLDKIVDFSDNVMFCCRNGIREIHIYKGIEDISEALKVPLHIDLRPFDNFNYKKTVTHCGVRFYQIFELSKLQRPQEAGNGL